MKTIKDFGEFVNEELSAGQKKLPEALQKSILAKQDKSGDKKEDEVEDNKDGNKEKKEEKKEDKKEKKDDKKDK